MNRKAPFYLTALLLAILAATLLLVQPYSFRWTGSSDSVAHAAPMRKYFGTAFHEESLAHRDGPVVDLEREWEKARARQDSAR